MIIVIFIVTAIIRRYKNKIISLTIAEELKYHAILQNATSHIYDSIVEFDITNDVACGEGTKKFMQQLGLKPNTSYSTMLQTIVAKHILPEHVSLYLKTFSPESIRTALQEQRNKLNCDFQCMQGNGQYIWFRETAISCDGQKMTPSTLSFAARTLITTKNRNSAFRIWPKRTA